MFQKYDFVQDMKNHGHFINANDIHRVKRSLQGDLYFVAKNIMKGHSYDIQKFYPKSGKLDFLVTDVDLEDAVENLDNVVGADI